MKFNIKKSMVVALITTTLINSALFIANLMSAYLNGKLLFGKEISGGECIEYIGFGVRILKIYSFGTIETANQTTTHIYFHPASILIPLGIVFVVTFLICLLIKTIKKNK